MLPNITEYFQMLPNITEYCKGPKSTYEVDWHDILISNPIFIALACGKL